MSEFEAAALVAECKSASGVVGEIEEWVQKRLDGSVAQEELDAAFVQLTQDYLCQAPPLIAEWEHLMIASVSNPPIPQHGLDSAKRAIAELGGLLEGDQLSSLGHHDVMTLVGALTIVLAAQRQLHQPIENLVGSIGEKFAPFLQEFAECSQDIWQRRGQMSGLKGLFVWDTREKEWRLSQDFKTYRAKE